MLGAAMQSKDAPHLRNSYPVTVALADKSPLVLSGLRSLVLQDARFNLVVTACDGERFLDAVRQVLASRSRVIGWEMPFKGGRAVLEALREPRRRPAHRGLHRRPRPRDPAPGHGPGCGRLQLQARAARAAPGDPRGRGRRADGLSVPRRAPARRRPARRPSAPRERELLEALGSGQTNAQLARTLGVSINTVKFHLRNLFDKIERPQPGAGGAGVG